MVGFAIDDGVIVTEFVMNAPTNPTSVAIQSNGKILVAGSMIGIVSGVFPNYDIAVSRYNSDGSPDTSLAGTGLVITDLGFNNNDEANSITVQPDGKMLLAGKITPDKSFDRFALVRYNIDGSLDTSFSNDGISSIHVVSNPRDYQGEENTLVMHDEYSSDYYGAANSVVMQTDGKILIAGTLSEKVVIARFNNNGSLDTSFANNGIAINSIGSVAFVNSLALQTDGKILVVGKVRFDHNAFTALLVRYNSDGSLDTSFANGGIATTSAGVNSEAHSMAVQSDGKILVAGTVGRGDRNIVLIRYNIDGSLDSSFSHGGMVIANIGLASFVDSISLQSDGKILVTGNVTPQNNNDNRVAALIRYSSDGSLDGSFSDDGIVTMGILAANSTYNTAVQTDGKILAAGISYYSSSTNHLILARYNNDGSLDGSFNAKSRIPSSNKKVKKIKH